MSRKTLYKGKCSDFIKLYLRQLLDATYIVDRNRKTRILSTNVHKYVVAFGYVFSVNEPCESTSVNHYSKKRFER